MRIGIIGYGHVGKAMKKIFKEAIVYDKYLKIGSKEDINNCDVSFICVPTPSLKGGLCDTTIVEEVISEFKCNLFIIRSTVYVGFTDYVSNKYKKNVVFQPEYYGETVNHPFSDLKNQNWLSFGGKQENIDLAIRTYQKIRNSNIRIIQARAKDIEMAKYMENSFLALKVIFCNEMFDIAKALGANYNLAREAWIADPRIGTSHTFVYEESKGYGGKCLPKDLASIISQADKKGVDATLIKSILTKNNIYKNKK